MTANQKQDKWFLAGTTLTISTQEQGRRAATLTLLLGRQSWVPISAQAQPAILPMMTLPTLALPSLGMPPGRRAMEIRAASTSSAAGDQMPLSNRPAISLAHLQRHLLPPLPHHLTFSEVFLLPLLLHKFQLRLLELLFQASHLLRVKVHPPWTYWQVLA